MDGYAKRDTTATQQPRLKVLDYVYSFFIVRREGSEVRWQIWRWEPSDNTMTIVGDEKLPTVGRSLKDVPWTGSSIAR